MERKPCLESLETLERNDKRQGGQINGENSKHSANKEWFKIYQKAPIFSPADSPVSTLVMLKSIDKVYFLELVLKDS